MPQLRTKGGGQISDWERPIEALSSSGVKELRRLQAENAKLRELFNETLIRLAAANEAADGGFMDARYCELLESYGIEVGEWANVSTSST